jgi:predicted metal-binding protein
MGNGLKSYPPTWEGELLLACRKCQKKLKGKPGMRALAKLKKSIKRRNKAHPEAALHLIGVPCMDMCPKGAVTICLAGKQPVILSLLRTESDIDELYQQG